jgi:hypothetical protein
MTFEKRCAIEPSDVLALTLECKKCGSAYRIPIVSLNASSAMDIARDGCNNCHTPSGFAADTTELRTLANFTAALGALATTMQGRNLRLRMEIPCADLGADRDAHR